MESGKVQCCYRVAYVSSVIYDQFSGKYNGEMKVVEQTYGWYGQLKSVEEKIFQMGRIGGEDF